MRKIYVRQAIESGLADSQAGRTTSVETSARTLASKSESPLDGHCARQMPPNE